MVAVAFCESSLDPNANRRDVDVGLFQINQVHIPTLQSLGLDRYDMEDNLAYARILYNQNGLRDWYMSYNCWSRFK